MTPTTSLQEQSNEESKLKRKKIKSEHRELYMDRYAKLLSANFWGVIEKRCADAKNNRNFVFLTLKEKLASLFDELHTGVTTSEFVGYDMTKDNLVSSSKMKMKLIRAISKYVKKM